MASPESPEATRKATLGEEQMSSSLLSIPVRGVRLVRADSPVR